MSRQAYLVDTVGLVTDHHSNTNSNKMSRIFFLVPQCILNLRLHCNLVY